MNEFFEVNQMQPTHDKKTQYATENGNTVMDTDGLLIWRIDKSDIVKGIQDLPAMPQVIAKAEEIIQNSRAGMRVLSDTLSMDQGIVARILRLANSAYYGLSGRVQSIQHACVLLGKEVLREVVLIAGLSTLIERGLPGYGYEVEDLWHHSIAVAACARDIARVRFPKLVQEAYLAGIIHDSGKIVLDPYIFGAKEAFDAYLSADLEGTFLNAEISILGYNHAEIAFDICRKWHIPEVIGGAVGFHHHPSLSGGNPISYIVHMADYIARSCGFGYGSDDLLYQPEEGAADFLDLGEAQLSELKTQLFENMINLDE